MSDITASYFVQTIHFQVKTTKREANSTDVAE